jgi:hypothetical protein
MTLDGRVRPARVDDVDAMVRLRIATWRNDCVDWLGTKFCDSSFERQARGRLRGFIEADAPFRRTLVLERGSAQAGFVALAPPIVIRARFFRCMSNRHGAVRISSGKSGRIFPHVV